MVTIYSKTSTELFLNIPISIMMSSGVWAKPSSGMFWKHIRFTSLKLDIARVWTFWLDLYWWFRVEKKRRPFGFSMPFWKSLINKYRLMVYQDSSKRNFHYSCNTWVCLKICSKNIFLSYSLILTMRCCLTNSGFRSGSWVAFFIVFLWDFASESGTTYLPTAQDSFSMQVLQSCIF